MNGENGNGDNGNTTVTSSANISTKDVGDELQGDKIDIDVSHHQEMLALDPNEDNFKHVLYNKTCTTEVESGSGSYNISSSSSSENDTDEEPSQQLNSATDSSIHDEDQLHLKKTTQKDHHHNDENHEPILSQETVEELINERDMAREDATASREILSCVMEAIQILTTQTKKTHIEMMASEPTPTQQKSSRPSSATAESSTFMTHHHPSIPSIMSDLSADFSRCKTESADEISDGGTEHDLSTVDSSVAYTFHNEATPPHGNNSKKNDSDNTRSKYSSKHSIASSSVATYMSEENKRFSQLLELSSRSPHLIDSEHLQQIKSDLMALGHSCQMIGENAHLLHNEASTFLVDLQDVNSKLNDLQLKHHNAEKVAMQLYKDNKRLRLKLEKNKNERKVLIQEVKTLREEKATQHHLLQAWDIHERTINKQNHKDTVDGCFLEDSPMLQNQKNMNDAPSTPSGQISSFTGMTPPYSMSPGFTAMLEKCQTMESSTNDDEKILLSAVQPSTNNKAGFSSLFPALQITPMPSLIDISENFNAKLSTQDLALMEEDQDDKKIDHDSKTPTSSGARIKLSKSDSNDSSPKENGFAKIFFGSKSKPPAAQKSPQEKVVITVKLPESHLNPINNKSKVDANTTSKEIEEINDKKSDEPVDAMTDLAIEEKKLPTPKVLKRKKKLYRSYMLS